MSSIFREMGLQSLIRFGMVRKQVRGNSCNFTKQNLSKKKEFKPLFFSPYNVFIIMYKLCLEEKYKDCLDFYEKSGIASNVSLDNDRYIERSYNLLILSLYRMVKIFFEILLLINTFN